MGPDVESLGAYTHIWHPGCQNFGTAPGIREDEMFILKNFFPFLYYPVYGV